MSSVESLRMIQADVHHARSMAELLFMGDRPSVKVNRSLFMRVFKAPQADFDRALHQWKHQHANFVEIANSLPKVGTGGASLGNLNSAEGSIKSLALKRCHGAWRALSDEEKLIFLREHNLTYSTK